MPILINILIVLFVLGLIGSIARLVGLPTFPGISNLLTGAAGPLGSWLNVVLLALAVGALIAIFSLKGWQRVIAAVVGVMAFATWSQAGGQWPWPTMGGYHTVSAASSQELVRRGCDGEEWFIRPPLHVRLPLPTNCQFSFDVTGGILRLQGRDGTEVDVARGQKAHAPPGFAVGAIWALTSDTSVSGVLQ